jgi:hypothetical protein
MKPLSLLIAAAAFASLACRPALSQTAAPAADPAPAGSAGGVAAPPPPASASAEDVARWRAAYINEGKSALLGSTAEAVEYAVGGTVDLRPQNRVRAWMRWEAFQPVRAEDGQVRSYTELVEVDCGEQRGRVLAMDTFPFNNLQGQSRHHDAQDPQWAYPRPNSALDGEVKALCGVRDMALMQLAAAAASQQPSDPKAGVASLALAAGPAK